MPTTPDTTAPSDPLGTVLDQIVGLLPGLHKGITTTEFWGTVASVVLAFIGLFNPIGAAHLTPLIREYAVVVGGAAPAVYAVCRTVLKYLHGKSVVGLIHEIPNELLTALATQPAQLGTVVNTSDARLHEIEATLGKLLNDTKAALPKRTAKKASSPPAAAATSAPASADTAATAAKPWAAGAPKG